MNIPLIVNNKDHKWKLVKDICTHFESRRFHQEMSKAKFRQLPKSESVIKVVILAMFFSIDITYAVSELKKRKELREFMNMSYVPTSQYVSRYLCRYTPEQFLQLIFGYLNSLCKKRSLQKTLIIDPTDIQVDINWFKKRIKKKDLEDKPYKWAYSSSKGYYIGYKLVFVVEYPTLRPVYVCLLEGCPGDATIYLDILETLRKKRFLRIGDMILADKGFCKYTNYWTAFTKYKIIPLIFPRKDFKISKILTQSYSIKSYLGSKSLKKEKKFFKKLYAKFEKNIKKWKDFRPIRSRIEDAFKLLKDGFFKHKIHRYTKKSCYRYVVCGVLLIGILFSEGFRSKKHLQTMSEW